MENATNTKDLAYEFMGLKRSDFNTKEKFIVDNLLSLIVHVFEKEEIPMDKYKLLFEQVGHSIQVEHFKPDHLKWTAGYCLPEIPTDRRPKMKNAANTKKLANEFMKLKSLGFNAKEKEIADNLLFLIVLVFEIKKIPIDKYKLCFEAAAESIQDRNDRDLEKWTQC